MIYDDLAKRAAEAVRAELPSSELTEIWRELDAAVNETDRQVESTRAEIERAPSTGDIEGLTSLRKKLSELKDEYTVLYQMRTDIYQARNRSWGAEAVRDKAKLDKKLQSALAQARKAHSLLADSERMAQELVVERQRAEHVGVSLVFDRETIRELATLACVEDHRKKQLMIDLGIGRPRFKEVA